MGNIVRMVQKKIIMLHHSEGHVGKYSEDRGITLKVMWISIVRMMLHYSKCHVGKYSEDGNITLKGMWVSIVRMETSL